MARLRLVLLLLIAAVVLPGQTRVRVLSYNIHHGEGLDGRFDLERIARVITSVDPDVVALQEVDVRTRRAGGVDQALELARLTRMHVVYGRTMPYQDGLYGNAVLSRWPAAGFTNHSFPSTPQREPRAVIEAAFESPDYRLFATHFDITAPDRLAAAARLRELIAAHPAGTPMILAGDLNDRPESPVLRALIDDWTPATLGAPLLTIPVKKPARQIDWILFRPAGRWRTVEARVLDEPVASDHLPLFAVLELLPPKQR